MFNFIVCKIPLYQEDSTQGRIGIGLHLSWAQSQLVSFTNKTVCLEKRVCKIPLYQEDSTQARIGLHLSWAQLVSFINNTACLEKRIERNCCTV
jgi:hypothetical protein